jgi:hypothetical protein
MKIKEIQALSLAKECYSMKLELLTNATVIDDAIRFASARSNLGVDVPKNSAICKKAKALSVIILCSICLSYGLAVYPKRKS